MFAIRDMAMRGFCSLDGETVLEWGERADAMAWLRQCYKTWGHNPNVTDDPNDAKAQARNRRFDPAQSPWDASFYDR
ncbi:hypothetical protein OG381_34530 [Streptomyces sp. NBC_00490]|uniref:hypothetical protein n=1 Tax=Streptomyces sp. NBC_00490 TaxID=2903657 RepID=UPI002E198B2D